MQTYAAGQVVCQGGATANKVWLILHGAVEFRDYHGNVILTLGENTYFGDEHLFVKDSVEPCDVVTIVGTRMYTLTRTSFVTVLSSFPEYQPSIIKWGDARRKNIPHNTRLSMYKLDHDKEEDDDDDSSSSSSSGEDDFSSHHEEDEKKESKSNKNEKVGLQVDEVIEEKSGLQQNGAGMYIDTPGDISANSITDQIARLENIATKLSRLIILQSGGEENHLDYSSGQGSPIVNNNNNKVLSMLQPSTMTMQSSHPMPPKILPPPREANIGARGNMMINKNMPPIQMNKSVDTNPRFGGGGYSIAENDDDDEYTI